MNRTELKNILQLLRVRQWYKNLVVFLALFFSGNMLNGTMLFSTAAAFIALAFISSANYILNDLIDLKKDQLHPEKKTRPLAAGRISVSLALSLALLTLVSGVALAASIGKPFLYAALILFLLSQLYTFYFKHIVFADVLTIAALFVVRAVSGALAIDVFISPWLVLCPFFLSLFLSVGKRHAELYLLKERAAATRKVLREYNHQLTDSLMTISTTLLVVSYALYSFLSEHHNLLYTLPLALFVILRFYYLVSAGSEIGRQPEQVIKDKAMIIGIVLWVLVTAGLIYSKLP